MTDFALGACAGVLSLSLILVTFAVLVIMRANAERAEDNEYRGEHF